MSKIKTEFQLSFPGWRHATVDILDDNGKPYLSIYIGSGVRTIQGIMDKDLERFAVNILRVIKSKKLK